MAPPLPVVRLASMTDPGSLPDVRDLPIADRRAVFVDALRVLTQMTGVVIAARDREFDSEGEYSEPVALLDVASFGDGAYECRDQWVSWERAADAPLRAQQERNRKAHALRMKLNEMRAILAVREQHKVTRGVDGLRADIAAAEAELRALEAQ